MRAITVLVLCAACSHGSSLPAFKSTGGTLAIADCGYAVTTKQGAETPFSSGTSFGLNPAVEYVHLGFVGDPRTSMVAQWRTMDNDTTAGYVRYAAGSNLSAEQLTDKVEGIEFRYEGTGEELYLQHQAHMCGLRAATTYSYQVGAVQGSTAYVSPVYTFTTAPDTTANPATESVIGVLGDSRDSAEIWGQLAGELQTRGVDMITFSGDAVLEGLDQDEWDAWFSTAVLPLATIPIIMVDGNHEADAINFYSQFAMPNNASYPQFNQENFGFDWGYAHFTIGNDTPDDASTLTTTTLTAIQADFAASTNARWKLLEHHQPMWSAGLPHGSDLTLQASWGPVVDQYAIDLVLNGHEHQYEITYPLKGGVVQPSNATGTVYAISGGAGADLYATGSGFWTDYTEMTYVAGVLDVQQDQMTLDSFRPDGTAIPTGFSKTKQ